MTRTATDEPSGLVEVNPNAPVPLRPDVVAIYESMIESVPEAGGDGVESILLALARATDPTDLDAPWRSEGLAELVNKRIVITGIRRMNSDYAGGLPWFLIIDGAIENTGETIAITTGSVSVVAQLVKAHAAGWFPLVATPRVSDRPSKSGFFPQHLEVHGRLAARPA